MAFGDRVVEFVVKITGDVRDLTSDLRRTEGQVQAAGGRLQTAASQVGGFIASNWQAGVTAAGAAIAAFGVSAVDEFQRTALEAGKLADTTGLSVEESSRWLDVLRRQGVEIGDAADVFNNINTKAAEGRFEELGISATTTNERIIELVKYISQVEDETERAKLMAEFFGEEGARQFATLTRSAEALESQLKAVGDTQVIDPKELEKARRYKEATDSLKTSMRDLQLAVGEGLVPALSLLAEQLERIKQGTMGFELPDWVPDWVTDFSREQMTRNIPGVGPVIGLAQDVRDQLSGAQPSGTVGQGVTRGAATQAPTVINITTGADPQAVVDAVRRYQRSNVRAV